jgi:murein DD-endopeptidase MepM/ murein hydrolase activator NlpD
VQNSSLVNPLSQVQTGMLSASGIKIEEKIRAIQNESGEKQKSDLKKVTKEFESIFIGQLLKVMRETIEESGLMEGGFGKSIYTELFDQEVSLSMAEHGALGIGNLLYRNMEKRLSESVPSNEASKELQPPAQASPSNSEVSMQNESEISDLQLPVCAPVSSSFGLRKDPFSHNIRFHKGLDLAAPEGTSVIAALPGKVIEAKYEAGYGNTIVLQHANGIQTRYGHLADMNVKAGDVVGSEDVLGTVGQTGRSTGPHLHFEVTRMGEPVNPLIAAGSHVSSWKQSAVHEKMGS